jgi:hypothetical protein
MEATSLSLSLEPVPEKQVDYYTSENVEVYDRYGDIDFQFVLFLANSIQLINLLSLCIR